MIPENIDLNTLIGRKVKILISEVEDFDELSESERRAIKRNPYARIIMIYSYENMYPIQVRLLTKTGRNSDIKCDFSRAELELLGEDIDDLMNKIFKVEK